MAYKCIRSTFAKRLFEQGEVYDSIGAADKKFFKEVKVADDAQVIETGLGTSEAGSSGDSPDAGGKTSERDEIKAALTELGVEFKGNASTDSLKAQLLEAQSNALTS